MKVFECMAKLLQLHAMLNHGLVLHLNLTVPLSVPLFSEGSRATTGMLFFMPQKSSAVLLISALADLQNTLRKGKDMRGPVQ